MIAPPKGWVTLHGWHWRIVGPSETHPILEVDIWHTTKAERRLSQDVPLPDNRQMAEWCAAYTTGALPEESPKHPEDTQSVGPQMLDRELKTRHFFDLKQAIIDLVTLEPEVLEDLQEFWRIQYLGGCECPFCEGAVDREDKSPHVDDPCKFSDLHKRQRTFRIASLYGPYEDVTVLDRPFWLYQIRQANQLAESEAEQERDEQQDRVQQAREMQKQRGIQTQTPH